MWVLVGVVCVGAACGDRASGDAIVADAGGAGADVVRTATAGEIEVWGCAAWLDSSTCEVGAPRRLTIVVEDGRGPVRVVGPRGVSTTVEAMGIEGALIATATVPPAWDRVQVLAAGRERTLALREAPAALAALTRADALRRSGTVSEDDVAAALAPVLGSTSAWARAPAHAIVGRAQRAAGRYEASRLSLELAAREYAAAGRPSQAAMERLTAAYVLIEHENRFLDADRIIQSVMQHRHPSPEVRVTAAYYAALLDAYRFDLGAALHGAREVRRSAARGRMTTLVSAAYQVEARVLGENLGEVDNALALLERARHDEASTHPCVRLALELNSAWLLILRVQSEPTDRRSMRTARRLLDTAEQAAHNACPSAAGTSLVLTHSALLSLAEGDPAAAVVALARSASVSASGPELSGWRREVEGLVALARGDTALALEAFHDAERIARDLQLPQARWRALSGAARAHAKAQQHSRALAALSAADAIADELVYSAPLGEGRDQFLASMERVTGDHVDYLIDRGDLTGAVRVARRAQVRGLLALQVRERLLHDASGRRGTWDQELEQYRRARLESEGSLQDAWKLSVRAREVLRDRQAESYRQLQVAADNARRALRAALSPCGSSVSASSPGELELLFHPRADRVTVIANGRVRVDVTWPVVRDPTLLGPALASALDAEFARAQRIRLMVPSSLSNIDLSAMRWRDGPLGAQRTVVYGADIPLCDTVERPRQRAVVIQPSRDLEHASLEAQTAAAALRARGFHVVELYLDQATHAAVLASLTAPDVGWLHFVGHGSYGGPDGTSSGLMLAHASVLGVADILSLSRVPDVVVLSGCETARTSTRSTALALGLAQAFLAAGAREVLAMARDVEDGPSSRLMAAFYGSSGTTVGDRLRDAWRGEIDNSEAPSHRALSRR